MNEEPASSESTENVQREDAVFLGWQTTPTGEVFPLYNVTAESHPLNGSTVTDETLRAHNLSVPTTPNKK